MHQSNLPQEWEITKLGNYIFLKNGYAFKTKGYCEKNNNNSTPVIRISDIDGIWASDENAVYTKEIPTGFNVRKGDLLIAMSGATTGKIGIYNGNEPAYQNQRVGNLKLVNEELGDNCFRNHLITYLQDDILKLAHGGAQPNIAGKTIENIEIALPPLAEQTHLAKLLDDLTARVHKIQESLDKIPALLKTFRQSVLARAVSGELTEKWREDNGVAFEWESKKLGEYLILKNGFAFKTKDYCEKSDDTIPIIRISDIDGKFSTSENAIHTKFEVSNFNVRQGDLLIAMSGATTGKMGIYIGDEPAYQNQRVGNMKFLDETGNNSFRNILMFSLQQQIFDLAHGGAQPNISGKSIENIKILLPALEEQTQIVDKVEHYFALADEIERQTKLAQEKVNYLTQSILAKAFRGELTANWRAANQAVISGENSAKALLQKIEAEMKMGKK